MSKYSLDNGFLKYKSRIVLSPTSTWKTKIFLELHVSPMAGHAGFLKTYKRITKNFYWEGMKLDIKNMVAECQVCQQNKYETLSPPGLLQPLPIPQHIWTDISMDFIVGLPPCQGKSVIFVVVDRLSKYAHFVAMSHPYTAAKVAQVFVENIFKLHGMPATIISDRDPVFISSFWKEFFRLQGSKLCMSSGYHPQTDGQTEVVNRCLETYLRCFTSLQPKKWVQWLSWAEWSYNTAFHTSTRLTPFEVVYGHSPPALPLYEAGTTKLDFVDKTLLDRDRILSLLKANLEAAQHRMKIQANKHRTDRELAVGDLVYLRLVPYQHMSLAAHPFHKLQPKFYGPFEVLERIGAVAYKLKLPTTSKLHPVFHVSCLKKHLGQSITPSPQLPILTDAGLVQERPVAILERRMVRQGNSAATEVLVQWQSRSKEDATWENYAALKAKFPEVSTF